MTEALEEMFTKLRSLSGARGHLKHFRSVWEKGAPQTVEARFVGRAYVGFQHTSMGPSMHVNGRWIASDDASPIDVCRDAAYDTARQTRPVEHFLMSSCWGHCVRVVMQQRSEMCQSPVSPTGDQGLEISQVRGSVFMRRFTHCRVMIHRVLQNANKFSSVVSILFVAYVFVDGDTSTQWAILKLISQGGAAVMSCPRRSRATWHSLPGHVHRKSHLPRVCPACSDSQDLSTAQESEPDTLSE